MGDYKKAQPNLTTNSKLLSLAKTFSTLHSHEACMIPKRGKVLKMSLKVQ